MYRKPLPKVKRAMDKKTLMARRRSWEMFAQKQQTPESMIFMVFPVLPSDLRTRSDISMPSDDLNTLYASLLQHGGFLEEAIETRMPPQLVRFRKISLQRFVDAVIDNGRVSKAVLKKNGEAMESVAARLKGKQGRMRSNLLGKRVDYSARTVIVVDPKLELDQCGMPFQVAETVFKGFLLAALREDYPDLRPSARRKPKDPDAQALDFFATLEKGERWRLMKKAMGNRLVMLNRAPTLHRLSVQAFKPILMDGQALKIHPLVCAPFNADFDGDTMTMHLALSDDAQAELRQLMLPSKNLSSPASGEPVIGPTQDMVLGIYYLTMDPPNSDVEPLPFCDLDSVATAHARGEVTHSTVVSVPLKAIEKAAHDAVTSDKKLAELKEEAEADVVRTTVGRALFFRCVHCHETAPKEEEDVVLVRDLEASLDRLPAVALAAAPKRSRCLGSHIGASPVIASECFVDGRGLTRRRVWE